MLTLAAMPLAFVPTSMVVRPRVTQPQLAMVTSDWQWQKPAVAALMAAALVFSPMDAANAGRSGGRVGGRAPTVSRAPARAPASTSSTVARPSVTNVYMAPRPMMGGYGMGYGYGGYGMGGGGNGMGLYLGLSVAEAFLREQQRQAYLQQQLRTQQQLGADQAAIQQLQMELANQNAKVDALRSQGGSSNNNPVQPQQAPAAPAAESEAMNQMKAQLLEQQKQIEALKAAN